jgi:hypothetical protein
MKLVGLHRIASGRHDVAENPLSAGRAFRVIPLRPRMYPNSAKNP